MANALGILSDFRIATGGELNSDIHHFCEEQLADPDHSSLQVDAIFTGTPSR